MRKAQRALARDAVAGKVTARSLGEVTEAIGTNLVYLIQEIGPADAAEFFERAAARIRAGDAAGEFDNFKPKEAVNAPSADDQGQ